MAERLSLGFLWASGLAQGLIHAHTKSWMVVDPSELCRPFYILGAQDVPRYASSKAFSATQA